MGDRDPPTWTIICYLLGYTIARRWNQDQSWDLIPNILIGVTGIPKRGLNHWVKCLLTSPYSLSSKGI